MSTGYQHLSGVDLAVRYSESEIAEVDLLIGSDVYRDVVTGEIIRGANRPVAINTRLGWVLSGPVQTGNVTSVNFTCNHILRVDSPTDAL